MVEKDLLILRDLTDDELAKLTDDELDEMYLAYEKNGIPLRATVKGLLEELNIDYKGLTDFILNLHLGKCNYAQTVTNGISIYRKNSPLKDSITINLDEDNDIPDVTIQIQVLDDFVHEEAYNKDGLLIYQS